MSDSHSKRREKTERDSEEESPDGKIESWLSNIKKLYGKDRIEEFEEEEPCLRAFLAKLKAETEPTRRLSGYTLAGPYRKGGTGIVFHISHAHVPDQELVLKFNRPRKDGDTRALVENEHQILPQLEHSNIIRVVDMGKFNIEEEGHSCPSLYFIIEPFIPDAMNLIEYVEAKSLGDREYANATLFDESLHELISILHQWVDALAFIHRAGFVYLDVKPDNAIVSRDGHLLVVDFGTVQRIDPTDVNPVEVYFSEPYAHPRLREKKTHATSTPRLRASVQRKDLNVGLDYYALGKSIMKLLEMISRDHPHDFPQRPLFQSLHFLATRLLDGMNKKKAISAGKLILSEVFGGLQASDYETIHYANLDDVLRDLDKEYGSWNPENVVPELRTYPKGTLRVIPDMNTVLTKRLISLIEHPLIARLKMVSQLGLISLVYPTADHTRYDHILGAYTYSTYYVKALFNDLQNCMFRNLVDEQDIKAILLASIVHDLGQYPLAHDLQEVHSRIFDHLSISVDLLSYETKDKDGRTLLDIIQDTEDGWGVEIERLRRILVAHSGQVRLSEVKTVRDFKADMLSAIIDGPTDADKADYIIRDSTTCRIPYGEQLDIERLLSVLTTVRIPAYFRQPHRVTIGVYEKGRASASAFSLARYLLFSSVYWHHTSRIIKAMLQYATTMILPKEVFVPSSDEGRIAELREKLVHFICTDLIPPFDHLREDKRPSPARAIEPSLTSEPSDHVLETLTKRGIEPSLSEAQILEWYPGISRTDWQMLNWLKNLSKSEQDDRGVALLDLIQQRRLYKRVHTIQRNKANEDLINRLDALTWPEKVKLCTSMQKMIYDLILRKESRIETRPLTSIDKVQRLFGEHLVVLVDIPVYKRMTGRDRPLIYVPELERKTYYRQDPVEADNLTNALDSLMKSISPVRVMCHPDLRQWIGYCVEPDEMEAVLTSALSEVKR